MANTAFSFHHLSEVCSPHVAVEKRGRVAPYPQPAPPVVLVLPASCRHTPHPTTTSATLSRVLCPLPFAEPSTQFQATFANRDKLGDSLMKWNLDQNVHMIKFRFDQQFDRFNAENFARDFFSDPTVQSHIEVATQHGMARGPGAPSAVKLTQLSTTATNLDFFDILKDEDTPGGAIVRDDGKIGGVVRSCDPHLRTMCHPPLTCLPALEAVSRSGRRAYAARTDCGSRWSSATARSGT